MALWALVLVGTLTAFYSMNRRWGAERDNLRVEIALDLSEIRTVAAANPTAPDGSLYTLSDVLKRFQRAGATSVAVEEDTIGGLEQSHRLTVVPTPNRNVTILQPLSVESYNRIYAALFKRGLPVRPPVATADSDTTTAPRRRTRRRKTSATSGTPADNPALRTLIIDEPITVVRTVGIGIDPAVAATVRDAGLKVLGRVGNFAGATIDSIDWTLQGLSDVGASTVVFTGEEVLGYAGPKRGGGASPNLQRVADDLASLKLNYGTVEFGKQQGDVELQRKAQANTVRVHTILGSEMANAEIPANVQRFLLASRERNIRVLFVRLFLSEPTPIETNADYVHQIASGLEHARPTHLQIGIAHGYPEVTVGRVVRLFIALGVAAGWMLLFDSITLALAGGVGRGATIAAGVVAIALIGLAAANFQGAKVTALAAGCVFPSLALLYTDRLRPDGGKGFSPTTTALIRFAGSVGITALGIVAMVGLLADRSFLIKTDEFLGVKAVSVAPTLLVALIYGLGLRASDQRPFRVAVRDAWAGIVRAASEPICLWQVAVALVGIGLVALVVMRSGNDSAVGVSPLELRFRSLLDLTMPARPRFKDIVGHPSLLIAFTLAAKGYRRWAFPLLLLGALGLSSMLDAFCHLHTPLLVAMTRDFIAILIGLIIYGIVYAFVLRRVPPARVIGVASSAGVASSVGSAAQE